MIKTIDTNSTNITIVKDDTIIARLDAGTNLLIVDTDKVTVVTQTDEPKHRMNIELEV